MRPGDSDIEARYGAISPAPMQAAFCEIVLFLAWHTAQSQRLAARFLFGMPDTIVRLFVHAPLWRIPWRLARLLAFGRVARLAMTVRLFRFFPFGADDYDMHERSFGDGRVCLDILRCPTVALYEDLGIPHLCRALVCDLDFGLANEWHARLERPQTLAEGDYQCDFRWTPVSTEGAP